jgi:hypothetical protein
MVDFGAEGMVLAHEPHLRVYGVIPEKCFIFKSAVMPMRMAFKARHFPENWSDGMQMPEMENYYAVVKNGDDVR